MGCILEEMELKPLEERLPIVEHDYLAKDHHSNNAINSNHVENTFENGLNFREVSHYRFCALLVAWMSVVLLLILATFSFTAAKLTSSSAAFGFGFDCVLDVGTSIVVIWRFFGPVGSIYSVEKERIALCVLGVLFITACGTIIARSIPELIAQGVPKDSIWVLVIASISSVVCFSLAISKFWVARKLNNQTIQSDGYSSLAGAITSLSWVITAFVIQKNQDLWFMDDIVGISVALLLLYYGLSLLYQNLNVRCFQKNKPSSLP